MPIIEPESFAALNFFPFQINPHYFNEIREDHNGETRDQRLKEFIRLNPRISVVGLPEGTALLQQKGCLKFVGIRPGVLFQGGETSNTVVRKEIAVGTDITYLHICE
jgi:dipeptidase E